MAGMVLGESIIVNYSFENTFVPDIGSTLSTITWNSGGTEGYAGTFSGQNQALSLGGFQQDEYVQFTLDATGFQNITLNSFRANGTGSAPLDWSILFSTDGVFGPYTNAANFALGAATSVGSSTIAGIALPSAANNNPFVVFRLIASSATRIDGNTAAANGTLHLDNLSISAAAVPESPIHTAFAGVFALFAMVLKWRKP